MSSTFAALLATALLAAPGPLDVTRAFYKALHAGDADAAARHVDGAGARDGLRSFVSLSRSYRALEEAVAERWGAEEAGRVGYGSKVQSEIKGLLGASEEIAGDDARIVTVDGIVITTLKRVKGSWRVELDDALATPAGRAQLAADAVAAERASKAVVRAIRAGEYPGAREALEDFQVRMRKEGGSSGERPVTPPADAPGPEQGVQL